MFFSLKGVPQVKSENRVWLDCPWGMCKDAMMNCCPVNDFRGVALRFVRMGILLLLLSGCEYEAPLSQEHVVPVDRSVEGHWEPVAEEGGRLLRWHGRVTILSFSDTEYLIVYFLRDTPVYFRGYAVELGGVSAVQVQSLETLREPPEKKGRRLYHVFQWQFEDGELLLRALNRDLVEPGHYTSDSLRDSFLKHKDHPDLFLEPARFRRVSES